MTTATLCEGLWACCFADSLICLSLALGSGATGLTSFQEQVKFREIG